MLADRLERQPEAAQRPTLTGRPIAEEMEDILRERAQLYRQAAHHEVNAMQAPEQVVEHILQSLSSPAPANCLRIPLLQRSSIVYTSSRGSPLSVWKPDIRGKTMPTRPPYPREARIVAVEKAAGNTVTGMNYGLTIHVRIP